MFRRRKEARQAPPLPEGRYELTLDAIGSSWSDFAPLAATLAAAETAAGLIDRAVTGGEVSGAGRFAPLIDAPLLSAVVRGMLFRGEQAVFFSMMRGEPSLTPCWHQYAPLSPGQPETIWVDLPSPGGSVHLTTTRDSVAIPHFQTDPRQPWRGTTPLDNLVSKVAAGAAGVLNREARSAHGYVMVGRDRGSMEAPLVADNLETAREELLARFGDTAGSLGLRTPARDDIGHLDYGRLFIATTASDFGIGQSDNKQGVQSRFGFSPPPEILAICQWASTETLAACGIPPNLIEPNLEPGRDAWRRFLTATAQPLANRIAAELSRVLEVDINIDLSPSRTSDELVGRARAAGSLAKAGVPVADALRLAGFEEPLTMDMAEANPAAVPAGMDG